MKRVVILVLCILSTLSGCWQNSRNDKDEHPKMENTLKSINTEKPINTGKPINTEFKHTPTNTDKVEATPATYIPDGKLVKKSTRAKYLVENDIVIDTEYIFDARLNSTQMVECPFITGIKDDKTKAKINNELKKILKDKIEFILKDNSDAMIKSVYTYMGSNANNICSLRMKIYGLYPSDKSEYYQINLNYNLKSGEQIKLKDIFTDRTDYVSLLNERITERILMDNLEEEQLRRPFDGIDTDQEFFLDQEKLSLCFGEEDGLLSNEGSIDIPYYEIEEYLDIFEKFQSQGESLYNSNQYLKKKNNLRIKYEYTRVEDKKTVMDLRYPQIMVSDNKGFAHEFNRFMKNRVSSILKDKDYNLIQNSSIPGEKRFISVMINDTFNMYGVMSFIEYGFDGYGKIYLYDLNKGKQFDLKRLISQNKELSWKVLAVAKDRAAEEGIDEKEITNELLFKKALVYPVEDHLYFSYERKKYNKNESKYGGIPVSYESMSETPESFFAKLIKP